MSSNNQVLIIKKGRKFEIHLNSCVDNKFFPSDNTLLMEETKLSRAVKYAEAYCRTEMIEYGYTIVGL